MPALLVVNTSSYGSEGPYDAMRPAVIHDLAVATVRSDRVVSF